MAEETRLKERIELELIRAREIGDGKALESSRIEYCYGHVVVPLLERLLKETE